MSELKPCPLPTFHVIDHTTGKEADEYEIALHEPWASHLCYCDMEGWAIEQDGTLILMDECNQFAYPPKPERFEVVFDDSRAQPANEPLTKISEMLEQAAQDMDDKCRQWQCVLQRVHDTGTFDQNSGLWVGIDKEREAKAQANFEAYRYSLGVIDKIAEHVSNPYKSAHKPGGEQDA
jgi:hypothetical protein